MRIETGDDGRQFAVAPHLPIEDAGADVHVVVEMTNTGRSPVLLQGWGGEWKIPENGRDKFVVISQGFPTDAEWARISPRVHARPFRGQPQYQNPLRLSWQCTES